jgi:glucose/arabinose dehydrogenase
MTMDTSPIRPSNTSATQRSTTLALFGSLALVGAAGSGCDMDDGAFVADAPPRQSEDEPSVVLPAQPREPGVPAGAGLDAGPPVDRNVFRPEERPMTLELAATLQVPSGFRVEPFAEGLGEARMLVARGSFLYVTRPDPGDVLRLADTDGDGTVDETQTVASGLPLVHGIVFRDDAVYLATDTEVLLASVDDSGGFGTPVPIITDLPDGGQHPRRTLGIGPDDRLYISVGSSCDACVESNPEHATLLVAALDGTGRSTFARGLRNTIGFGWHPATQVLWGMDHGSDWRGDDLPPEELNAITLGADFGWPYCYGDRTPDPVMDDPPGTTQAARCASTSAPTLSTQAHDAPIGLTFYAGTGFPEDYRDDAFIAMHGSWNRLPPTGYQVTRLVFEDGVPQRFEPFVTGFLIDGGRATFGRPAGITVAPDGTLLFSDDTNGVIYRVSYTPILPAPTPTAPAAPSGTDAPADAGPAPDAG